MFLPEDDDKTPDAGETATAVAVEQEPTKTPEPTEEPKASEQPRPPTVEATVEPSPVETNPHPPLRSLSQMRFWLKSKAILLPRLSCPSRSRARAPKTG